jgi:hypothetical protein
MYVVYASDGHYTKVYVDGKLIQVVPSATTTSPTVPINFR